MPVQKKLNLPVASMSHRWLPEEAAKRIREWAGGDEPEVEQVRRGFLFWEDSSEEKACKLGYCDIVNGELAVIPQGVFEAAMLLAGAGGDISGVPGQDIDACKALVSKWYKTISKTVGEELTTPWEKTQEKLVELQGVLFQAEYFIAHLSPESNKSEVAVEILALLGKLQDFQVTCPLTGEADALFFKLSYFLSHIDSNDFAKMAVEGLEILKEVHEIRLLHMPNPAVVDPETDPVVVQVPLFAEPALAAAASGGTE